MKQKDRFKIVAVSFCLFLAALAFLPNAMADTWNKKTIVTFSGPVEVPGVGAQVLPAGTYMFKLLDSSSDRNIVQIFNEDGTHVFTTILAIPNYRLKPTDKTVVTFRERAEGQPEAIRAWFYPGMQWGQEFVYPKLKAIELAKVSNEPVPATTEEPTEVAALKEVPVEAVTPAGEEVPLAQAVEAPPVETASAAATEPMPKTASEMPLLALMGLLSLGAGFALWAFSKRTA
ncbi:MAG TPA: LPXTG cell wall anchor domain-containing protein [Terriglobia bacterium]|nr:LPXTG cell wall anchor domain-containing protein [Terriglobia bacterium]